jgi:hypothetical protein
MDHKDRVSAHQATEVTGWAGCCRSQGAVLRRHCQLESIKITCPV